MIDRDELQAWLDAQPEERQFEPDANRNCPIYHFLMEEKGYARIRVFTNDVIVESDGRTDVVVLPLWATYLQDKWMISHHFITAKQAADEMRELINASNESA